MGTWKLEDLPEGRSTIGCRWVFMRKYDEKGNIARHKARLVAQGFSQIPGMDFNETFAPVVRHDSLRAVLAIGAIKDLEIQQLDVKGAYLNGDLQEEIYMRQPEGFDDGSGRVCRLYKTLYGLKQSGREWNRKLNTILTEFGFERSRADYCVYTRHQNGGTAIITVWVDDLLVLMKDKREMDELKERLKSKLEINDLGEPKLIIGLEIDRDRERRTIKISQKNYIEKILHQYGLRDANPVATPLDPSVVLTKHNGQGDTTDEISGGYAAAVGSLMYAAIGTRPDIAYAVQTLSKYTADPGKGHWTALKRVFRYLTGSRDCSLIYGPLPSEDSPVVFTAYSDADHAADPDDRKSISGYAILLGGAAIAWNSKKQNTVALSSTEAEYTAIAHATRQIIWLRYLFEDLGYPQEEPTLLFADNDSAIALTGNPQFHARSKHFDVQNHFVREKLEDETIDVIYCPTGEMVADIFTKGLPRQKHEKFAEELGMQPA
jgi:hypothetical protein